MNYQYKAHDRKSGKEVRDIIEAGSQAEAISQLKKLGLLPIEVKESKESKKSKSYNKVAIDKDSPEFKAGLLQGFIIGASIFALLTAAGFEIWAKYAA